MAKDNTPVSTTTEQSFNISLFSGSGDAKPRESIETWAQLTKRLSTFKIRAKKDGQLFSPAKFSPKHREKKNVKEVSLLVLDYDHDVTISLAIETWQRQGVSFLLYTTHSHQRITKEHPKAEDCFRLVIPLAEPISANEFPRLWDWAKLISGGKLDSSCKDSSRMFYLPTKASKDAPSEARSFDGVLLDWRKIEFDKLQIESLKPKVKKAEADDSTPEGGKELNKWLARLLKANNGSRNDTLNKAAYWLGHSVGRKELSELVVIEALQRTARAIGLDEREIAATINSGLYDGIAHATAEAAIPNNETAKDSDTRKRRRRFASGRILFTVDEKGVWAANSETQIKMKVCSPLYLQANTRNTRGEGWGLLLSFQDSEGHEKSLVMPRAWLAGDRSRYREILFDMGLAVSPEPEAQALLHSYLLQLPEQFALTVDRVGWAEDGFVFPDSTICGKDCQRIYLQASSGVNNLLETSGTLSQWQQSIAHYCIGNSRLVFSVSAAFAASLLTPLGIASGGFHFMGESGVGKSTSQYVAGSVWGGGGKYGYVRTWKATATGLEYLSEYHNDNLLCLDEIGEANPKEIGQSVYMIANGQGKHRGSDKHSLQRQSVWTVLALSSGEKTLSEYMAEADQKSNKGQEVRLIHLPADAGAGWLAFEDIYEFNTGKPMEDGKEFSDYLRKSSTAYYGTPIRAFLDRLINQRLVALILQKFGAYKKKFFADNLKKGADSMTGRAVERFAVVGFSGELASEWNITGWPIGEATKAASRLFNDWMIFRGQRDGGEDAGVRRVIEFIERHGSSRFQFVDKDGKAINGEKVNNRAGFRKHDEKGNLIEYAIFREVFKHEVCAGLDEKQIAKVCGRLKAIGLLAEADGNNLPAKRTLGEFERKRYFVINNLSYDENEVGQVGQSDATEELT